MRRIALPALARAERNIALKIRALLSVEPHIQGTANLDNLKADQIEAVNQAMASNVFILSGAPGTGKTYTTRSLIASFDNTGARIKAVAPTGKAAKRTQELTGIRALTIHKCLDYRPGSNGSFEPTFNEENKLPLDVLVVDESSMIDVLLFARLLEALPTNCRLILVGDIHQLPAVGPGNVLKDLIAAGVPCVELTVIKRQDAGRIITNCHRIKNGEQLEIDNKTATDFFWMERSTEDEITATIVDLVRNRLREKYSASRDEIQVITPLREQGKLSTKSLNAVLQAELNPNEVVPKSKFALGDRVIQLRNDYALDTYNGDLGTILNIDQEAKLITVEFENPKREVNVPLFGNDLDLAYSITCHKFQGSEARIVVIPIHKSQGVKIAQRSWLYTATSRAKEVVVFVGASAESYRIIQRCDSGRRFTSLQALIDGGEVVQEVGAPPEEVEAFAL